MRIEQETITPEMAKEYLAFNTINRPLRMRVVEGLMRDMKSGKFKLTHQGIAFDSCGNLIDGQHRLTACALSGVPITTLVARECDDVEHIDKGAKRTFTDARFFDTDIPKLKSNTMTSVIRQLIRVAYNGSLILTDDEILSIHNKYPAETDAIYKAFASKNYRLRTVCGSAGMAAIMCGESPDVVSDFYKVLVRGYAEGCEEYNISAPLLLSKTLTNYAVARETPATSLLYNMTCNAIWLFIHGTPITKLGTTKKPRYPVSERFEFLGGTGAKNNNTNTAAVAE